MTTTVELFDSHLDVVGGIFGDKYDTYGPSFRVFRFDSLIDQIYIKAARIRSLEVVGEAKVAESATGEYRGVMNYAVLALDRIRHDNELDHETVPARWSTRAIAEDTWRALVAEAKTVMVAKDHDYASAWRSMSVAGLTDELLVRVARIRHLRNAAAPNARLEPELIDLLNYAFFGLVRFEETPSCQ